MVDLGGVFRRARAKGRSAVQAAPEQARRVADDARRTAGALGEVLDEKSDGRLGAAVARGGEVVSRVAATPGEARDVFRAEARAEAHRPQQYRPDPIEPPAPIDRPEPI